MFDVKTGVGRNIMEELFEIVDKQNYNFRHDFQIKRDNIRSVKLRNWNSFGILYLIAAKMQLH